VASGTRASAVWAPKVNSETCATPFRCLLALLQLSVCLSVSLCLALARPTIFPRRPLGRSPAPPNNTCPLASLCLAKLAVHLVSGGASEPCWLTGRAGPSAQYFLVLLSNAQQCSVLQREGCKYCCLQSLARFLQLHRWLCLSFSHCSSNFSPLLGPVSHISGYICAWLLPAAWGVQFICSTLSGRPSGSARVCPCSLLPSRPVGATSEPDEPDLYAANWERPKQRATRPK